MIEAERQGATSPEAQSVDNTLSFNINNIEVKADNAKELVDSLIEIGSNRSGIDIMDAFDRREAV